MTLLQALRATSWLIFLTFLSALPCAQADENTPSLAPLNSGGLIRLDGAQLVQLRADWQAKREPVFGAVNALITKADKLLLREPPTIVNGKPLAASGNPNDYFSFASYWWPNPNSADGFPWIREDGKRNPLSSGPGSDKAAWNSFVSGINDLSLAYFYTQDKRYAEKAADYARTWMLNPATRMNPHLNYAQAIPGQFDGRSYGIIDFSRNHEMLDALLLIEPAKVFAEAELVSVRTWVKALLVWMLESPLGIEEKKAFNNHGTFYDAQVLALALYLGEQEVARQSVHRAKQRLKVHVVKDGRQPHELARTKPYSYSVFNLLAYTSIAAMAPRVDQNLWHQPSQADSSMANALAYILSRVDEDSWGGSQESSLQLDRLAALILAAPTQVFDANSSKAAEILVRHMPKGCLVRFATPPTVAVEAPTSAQCHY